MRKLIYLLLLVVSFASCRVRKEYIPVPVVRDSIVERTVRDTFYVPGEQRQSVVAVDSSHLETDYSFSDASIDSIGRLHHSIQNKTKIPAKIHYEKIVVHDSVSVPYPVKGDPYPVEKIITKKVRGFFWYSGLMFYICLFIIILNKINKQFSLWKRLTKGL